MSDFLRSYGVTSYISQEILIVLFQADFYVEVIEALRQDILQQLHNNPEIKGLIIDLSKVALMDLQNMIALEQTLNMAAVLGVNGFLVGIMPSVTLVLVELGYEGNVNTALTIERAILLIHQSQKTYEVDNVEQEVASGEHNERIEKLETNDVR